MAIEQFANLAASTLNGAINNSTTSLVVASAATFKDVNGTALVGNFRILIDSEIMLVSAVSGTTFTVSRGYEGTSAASHSNGVAITAVLTAGALLRLYGISQEVYPVYTDPFGTWVNQKSSTVVTANGVQYLSSPADTNDSWSFYLKAIPSAPYSCIFRMKPILASGDFSAFGAIWYDSITGGFKTIQRFHNGSVNQLNVSHGSGTPPAVAADYVAHGSVDYWEWYKLADDNTSQTYSISQDGQNWYQVYTQTRNTDVTPNKVGIGMNARNAVSQPVSVWLFSYLETSP